MYRKILTMFMVVAALVSVGLKVDFPFHFTAGNGRSLFRGIIDNY